MQLSEAIRLGAMLKPQGFGSSFHDDATCALRAAADAVGISVLLLFNTFQDLRLDSQCPICSVQKILMGVIWHLSDDHRWTRAQIADWVALNERSESATSVDAVDPVGERVTA